MSENTAVPDEAVEPVEADDDTTNPYADHDVTDGVGAQDDEASELDPEVGTR